MAASQRVHPSCGRAVPLINYGGRRNDLSLWAAVNGEAGLVAYRAEKPPQH